MKRVLGVLLVASIAAVPSVGGTLTPAAVEQMVRRGGAAATARRLSPPAFDQALEKAAEGNSSWLGAITALRAGTDAARAEAIDKALSDALQTNPRAVLSLIRAHPQLPRAPWFCQDRAIEPQPGNVRHFAQRAFRAVHAVHDPALRSARDQCLTALTRS